MKNIPNYVLYGEKENDLFPDYLHIESIRARSLQHGWKFRPHLHHNLYQFFFISKGGGHVLIEEEQYPLADNLLIVMPPPDRAWLSLSRRYSRVGSDNARPLFSEYCQE